MSLNGAIKHYEEMANMCQWGSGDIEREREYRKLAEWLKDYQRLLKFIEDIKLKINEEKIQSIRAKQDDSFFALHRIRGFIDKYISGKEQE